MRNINEVVKSLNLKGNNPTYNYGFVTVNYWNGGNNHRLYVSREGDRNKQAGYIDLVTLTIKATGNGVEARTLNELLENNKSLFEEIQNIINNPKPISEKTVLENTVITFWKDRSNFKKVIEISEKTGFKFGDEKTIRSQQAEQLKTVVELINGLR